MDITTVIVAVVLLAICIVPMAILSRYNKKKDEQNENKE